MSIKTSSLEELRELDLSSLSDKQLEQFIAEILFRILVVLSED